MKVTIIAIVFIIFLALPISASSLVHINIVTPSDYAVSFSVTYPNNISQAQVYRDGEMLFNLPDFATQWTDDYNVFPATAYRYAIYFIDNNDVKNMTDVYGENVINVTTLVDTKKPIISNLKIQTTITTATFMFSTDTPSKATLQYSKNQNMQGGATVEVQNKDYNIFVEALDDNALYYYRLWVKDYGDNDAYMEGKFQTATFSGNDSQSRYYELRLEQQQAVLQQQQALLQQQQNTSKVAQAKIDRQSSFFNGIGSSFSNFMKSPILSVGDGFSIQMQHIIYILLLVIIILVVVAMFRRY